ncbi:MAG TPA: alkaline phosphatase family protein, partial [Candidatus Limiplasma sp.]|nr:alkaline phosphatase family protein [Candidatus Limiplasma sp.]
MSKHVIVISNDAMVYEDLETLKTLPNFSRLWDKMAFVKHVRSVYPSLTYPCHTTMMTGVYPDKHGIVNNETPEMLVRTSVWHLFRKDIRGTDLFDVAKKAGLTTASVFWPVTGNHPHIDYLVNEYWPQDEQETLRDCFANSGSSPEVMEKVVDANIHRLVNRTHPYCDDFIYSCAGSIVREFKPNLLMIHPANIDDYRHKSGVFSDLVTHGLHEVDNWMGTLIKATKDAGIYEDTDFIMVSDHGQLNIVRALAMNAIFRENGLIETDEAGNITDYTAFCKSSGLSAQVYLKNPDDRNAYARTYEVLNRLCDDGIYGISRVYTAGEAQREEHLSGGFSFVLETDGYTAFNNDWVKPVLRPKDVSDYRYGNATHGHHPNKGPQPTFFAFGPDIQPGAVVERARLVDEAPTIAKILGVRLDGADG